VQPGSIVNTVETVLVVVVGIAALIGKWVGRRTNNVARSLLRLAVAAIVLNVVCLAAVQPVAAKIGPIVTRQTLLFTFMVTACLLGGFAGGVARQRGNKGGVIVFALVAAGLFGVGLFEFMTRVNDVLNIARDVGLLGGGQKYEPNLNQDCPENLKSLYIAFQQYAQDWDALPPAANWMANDDLVSKVTHDEWLHCPSVSNRTDDKFGYAYNDGAAGMKMNGKHNLADLPNAAHTPLLYDSTNLSKSAHDALKSLPKPGRHTGRNNILYLDGHVDAVAP
jgi:prepilin-type processing-associated H-X9-DG protein